MAKLSGQDEEEVSFCLDLHFGQDYNSGYAVLEIIKGKRPKTYPELILKCEKAGISKARVCRQLRWLKKTGQVVEINVKSLNVAGKRICLSKPIIFYAINREEKE